MSDHLPIPPELEHLIEKRDREADRRQGDRRDESDPADTGGTMSDEERRQEADRRQQRRRKSDS